MTLPAPLSESGARWWRKITQSESNVVFLALLSIIVIGIVDYVTGVEISVAIFYLLPISFATWFAGRRVGIVISVLSTILWFTVDFLLLERHYSHLAIPYWNATTRGGIFIFVVLLLSRLKIALVHEKETSRIKSDMLSLVGGLNLTMASTLDLHTVGKSLLDAVEVFFPGCATTIRLLNRESGNLEPLVSCNLKEEEWAAELSNFSLAEEVLEIKAPLIVRNLQNDPRTQDIEFFRRNGLVSYLSIPLIARGESLGIISLYNYNKVEHEFTKEEIAFFTTLGGQAAIAFQNARLFEEVRASDAQLRDLSRRLLEVQEAEHRHIARELHDEIGQILTGLKLTLELSCRLPPDEAGIKLARAQTLLNELIARTRRLSLDLRPSMLDDLGLFPTLRWHFERYSSDTQVNVAFSPGELEGKRFSPQIETAAYRIVQEALTNVARHAGVKQVVVDVRFDQDRLSMAIADKGIGFDPAVATRAGKVSGLTGMRERTMLLGGKLKIESAPGAGTSVMVEFPLAEPSEKEIRQ